MFVGPTSGKVFLSSGRNNINFEGEEKWTMNQAVSFNGRSHSANARILLVSEETSELMPTNDNDIGR